MREKDVNLPCRIFAILVMLFLLAPLVVIVIASFTPQPSSPSRPRASP